MKNNKGFTLIELLGTLIVMAVVFGIAIPLYLNLTLQNKDDLFRDNVKNLFTVIRTVNVVENGQTSGCIKNVEFKGIALTGSWELNGDTIIVHNVSDGFRSIKDLSEDDLKTTFAVERKPIADTCE